MTAEELWKKYCVQENVKSAEYEAWQFGDDADLLAELTVKGVKTATTSLHCLYQLEGEELPKEGEYSIILNAEEEAVCVIQTTKVYVVPYCGVTEEHAYKEGEGDRSLAYWRRVHTDFFTKELEEIGMQFTESMEVVCEEFELVYAAE